MGVNVTNYVLIGSKLKHNVNFEEYQNLTSCEVNKEQVVILKDIEGDNTYVGIIISASDDLNMMNNLSLKSHGIKHLMNLCINNEIYKKFAKDAKPNLIVCTLVG